MPQMLELGGRSEDTLYNGQSDCDAQGETMRYIRPLSIEDAVELLAGSVGTAAILAGGSDLQI